MSSAGCNGSIHLPVTEHQSCSRPVSLLFGMRPRGLGNSPWLPELGVGAGRGCARAFVLPAPAMRSAAAAAASSARGDAADEPVKLCATLWAGCFALDDFARSAFFRAEVSLATRSPDGASSSRRCQAGCSVLALPPSCSADVQEGAMMGEGWSIEAATIPGETCSIEPAPGTLEMSGRAKGSLTP